MKKNYRWVLIVVAATSLVLGGTVYAFNMEGSLKSVGKGLSKKGVESAINKDLRNKLKEKNCGFKPNTPELTCNLNDILAVTNAKRVVAEESGFANDVDIHVEVEGKDYKLRNERLDNVRKLLKKQVNYWDWYENSREGGDKLDVYVSIH